MTEAVDLVDDGNCHKDMRLPGMLTGDTQLTPKLARAVGSITDSPARIEATQLALADALRRKPEHKSEEAT